MASVDQYPDDVLVTCSSKLRPFSFYLFYIIAHFHNVLISQILCDRFMSNKLIQQINLMNKWLRWSGNQKQVNGRIRHRGHQLTDVNKPSAVNSYFVNVINFRLGYARIIILGLHVLKYTRRFSFTKGIQINFLLVCKQYENVGHWNMQS